MYITSLVYEDTSMEVVYLHMYFKTSLLYYGLSSVYKWTRKLNTFKPVYYVFY